MPKLGFSKGKKTVVKLTGVDVQIQSYSAGEVLDYLQNVGLRAKDMQVPLQRFGAYLVDDHIARQFAQQGTPKRWAPLSKRYAAWKRANYGNLPKLVLTGAMRDSFTYQVTPHTLRIESRVKYWTYHQTGTRKMPARPILNLTRKDRDTLSRIALDWITFETGGGVL